MKDAHFLKISRGLNPITKLLPLALENVNLQVLIQIVDQETHVLSELESNSEHRLLTEMFHAADFLRPNVLQLKLYTLDWKQESVERIVFLMDVRTEHQVDGPVALVN